MRTSVNVRNARRHRLKATASDPSNRAPFEGEGTPTSGTWNQVMRAKPASTRSRGEPTVHGRSNYEVAHSSDAKNAPSMVIVTGAIARFLVSSRQGVARAQVVSRQRVRDESVDSTRARRVANREADAPQRSSAFEIASRCVVCSGSHVTFTKRPRVAAGFRPHAASSSSQPSYASR